MAPPAAVSAPAAGVDYDRAVAQFHEALYKFALGLTGRESDAVELTEDTYRVLLDKGDALRDPRKVKRWLFMTLHRHFLGWRRHAARARKRFFRTAERNPSGLTTRHTADLEGAYLLRTLQHLEEKYRAPLVLFYLEEFSAHEVADVLEMPASTVLLRLERGKELLCRQLRETPAESLNRRDSVWLERSLCCALPHRA